MTELEIVERMGKDINVIRSVLIDFMCNSDYQKLTTRNEKDELNKAQSVISDYRSQSESYFFKHNIIDSTKVFYGLGIKTPPYTKGDVCDMCNKDITEDDSLDKLSNYHTAQKMGKEMQLIRREVKKLMTNPEYVRLADKDITDKLSRLIHYLDRYITKTATRLIKNNVITNDDAFYNLDKGIDDGNIVEVCLLCHQDI